MAIRLTRRGFYLFGKLNTDGASSVYDDSASNDRVRLYFCDKEEDLPASVGSDDIAIVKKTKKLYFEKDGAWTPLKEKD